MMLRTRRAPLTLAAACVLALSGCESATGSAREAGGTVTFSYAGDRDGTYNASGRFTQTASSWAFGNRATAQGEPTLAVYARTRRSGTPLVDDFLLAVSNPAVGTFTCTEAEVDDCAVAAILLLGSTPDGTEVEAAYASTEATVNITSIDENIARGTFVLTMRTFEVEDEPREVTVTSGSFEVPLVRGGL